MTIQNIASSFAFGRALSPVDSRLRRRPLVGRTTRALEGWFRQYPDRIRCARNAAQMAILLVLRGGAARLPHTRAGVPR
jgi:hypothetical protein